MSSSGSTSTVGRLFQSSWGALQGGRHRRRNSHRVVQSQFVAPKGCLHRFVCKAPGTRSPRTTCLCQARLASLMLTEQVVYPSLHGSCASLCMKLCVKLCDRCRVGRRPGRLSVKLACSDVAWPDVEPEPPEPPAGQGSKLSSSGSAWGPPDETSSTEEAKSEGCRAGLDMALPFAFLHELFGRRSKLSEDCLSLAPLFATQVVEAHLAKSCGKMCMEVALRHVRSWRSKTSFLSAACSAEVLALYMAHVRICHASKGSSRFAPARIISFSTSLADWRHRSAQGPTWNLRARLPRSSCLHEGGHPIGIPDLRLQGADCTVAEARGP